MLLFKDVQQKLSCRKKSNKITTPQGRSSQNPTARLPRGNIYLRCAPSSHREVHIKVECFINLTRTPNSSRQLDVHLLEKMKLNCQVFKEEICVVHLNRQVAHLQHALQAADGKVSLSNSQDRRQLVLHMSAGWKQG